MSNYEFKKLYPFKWFVLQNFPYIDEDFDAITNYQLFCKLGEEINKIINSQNLLGEQVENLTNAFNTLKEYVENYLDNLDITTDVSNKLDEMATDGTLDNIIKPYIGKYSNKTKIHFPYRGTNQGDCYIIENDGKVIIVDLGKNSDTSILSNYLITNELTKIDYMIISHYHGDHIAQGIEGFSNFVNNALLDFTNCKFLLPFTNNGAIYNDFIGDYTDILNSELAIKSFLTENNYEYEELETDEIITLNEYTKLKFLNADLESFTSYYSVLDADNKTDYNNFCSIFELYSADKVFLGTADIGIKAQEVNASKINNIDVLKIEHHGVNQNSNINYLKKVKTAEYGICLNTSSEIYSHKKQTVDFFRFYSNLIFADDIQANIIITIDGNTIISNVGANLNEYTLNNLLDSANINTQVLDLKGSENLSILEDLDLNNAPIGTFTSVSTDIGNYLNAPENNISFRLIVSTILSGTERLLQIFIANNNNNIYYRKLTSDGWTSWQLIDTLGIPNEIPNNADLNNYIKQGKYNSGSSTKSATISNIPVQFKNHPFILEISLINNERRLRQFIYSNSGLLAERFMTGYDEDTNTPTFTQWYIFKNYGVGENILNNTDLNTVLEPGKYYVGNATSAGTITNKPTGLTNAAFVLEVENINDYRRLRQKIWNNQGEEFVRFMTAYNEGTQTPTFTTWKQYTIS